MRSTLSVLPSLYRSYHQYFQSFHNEQPFLYHNQHLKTAFDIFAEHYHQTVRVEHLKKHTQNKDALLHAVSLSKKVMPQKINRYRILWFEQWYHYVTKHCRNSYLRPNLEENHHILIVQFLQHHALKPHQNHD